MIGLEVEMAVSDNDYHILSGKKSIGRLLDGKNIKSKLFSKYPNLYMAELNLDLIDRLISSKEAFKSIPTNPFPSIERDLSFSIDKTVPYKDITDTIFSVSHGRLLKDISLFDLYEGDDIEVDKHSLALSFTFISDDRTLVDKEIDDIMDAIVSTLKDKYKIIQR